MTDMEPQIEETVPAKERRTWLAIGGGAALVAAIGGVLVGRTMTGSEPPAAEESEETHGREGFVEMTPARLASSGIRTTRLELGSLGSEIIAQATVTAPPEGQALLTARADGTVVRINKRLGD